MEKMILEQRFSDEGCGRCVGVEMGYNLPIKTLTVLTPTPVFCMPCFLMAKYIRNHTGNNQQQAS
jgi:hypothetical protein